MNQHELYELPLAGGVPRFEVVGQADERVLEIDSTLIEKGLLIVTFENRTSTRFLYLKRLDSGKWTPKHTEVVKKLAAEVGRTTAKDSLSITHGKFNFHSIEGIAMSFEAWNRIWNRRESLASEPVAA